MPFETTNVLLHTALQPICVYAFKCRVDLILGIYLLICSSEWFVEIYEAVAQRCSARKGLKNFAKFTEGHLCRSLCFNKVASLPPISVFAKVILWKASLTFCKCRLTEYTNISDRLIDYQFLNYFVIVQSSDLFFDKLTHICPKSSLLLFLRNVFVFYIQTFPVVTSTTICWKFYREPINFDGMNIHPLDMKGSTRKKNVEWNLGL